MSQSAPIARLVSDWFAANARDLPWREPGTTAWGVLVSEVMSQQTPVRRVEPVWREWMERWPTPADLAAEPTGEAIRAWGRLGYPRRALRLHAAAVAVAGDHDNVVPDTIAALEALPGIGTYTARAVAAFAHRQRHPVVDTNVRRVVARAVAGNPDAGMATTAADLRATETLLPDDAEAAAVASAALMELGALICTARAPVCARCPLADDCAWHAKGEALPEGPSRKPQKYTGTDRHVRGLIMAVLREADDPVARVALDTVWHEPDRRERALTGLVADGLVVEGAGGFRLP
ncbi:A/G-specific adenine glycosylase [Phytomonospora endophytica]|uniref:Adenine DNA glycosylase n=1 Tax=Phytomonospora endophytica TaxID=714109 RepID=A0A841G258_9ACTN|nr:A/G-specific adenine glycosylase [Phytomonospora endophytica]MBB6039852.1 A/G-specific adenine glycosylase [Phytomonospora endophytica]